MESSHSWIVTMYIPLIATLFSVRDLPLPPGSSPAQNSWIFAPQLFSHILLGKDAEGCWVSFKYWSLEILVIKPLLTDLSHSEIFFIIIIITIFYVYSCFVPNAHGDQKKALDPLKL